MDEIEQVKRNLLAEIDSLPAHRLPEVLDFVSFLRYQEGRTAAEADGAPADPLAQFIGGVEHGALAQDIEAELYPS